MVQCEAIGSLTLMFSNLDEFHSEKVRHVHSTKNECFDETQRECSMCVVGVCNPTFTMVTEHTGLLAKFE